MAEAAHPIAVALPQSHAGTIIVGRERHYQSAGAWTEKLAGG
jgi:hypothetical protein